MKIFVSRYANPELKGGLYTAVRISIGAPRWEVGYPIAGAIKALMPFGLFGDPRYEEYLDFRMAYFDRLNRTGVTRIRAALSDYEGAGKDIALLCFEDVRQPGNWCHRTMFSEWWRIRTGEEVPELFDPTPRPTKPYSKQRKQTDTETQPEQLSIL